MKAEFEAMKKDFNDQIDNYNTSIDNKIDGSIASYLAGIKLSKPFFTNSNIKEIKYTLQIIHHMKRFEECDDTTTADSPQLDPLWAPSWNILSVNIRGNYRVFDKTVLPDYDKVSLFISGKNEDTTSNGDFKANCMTSGYKKTVNLFFQIDGWGQVSDDSGHTTDNTVLSYAILADDNGTSGWGFNNWNGWENRSSYIVVDYKDYEKYNVLDSGFSITTASSKQNRSSNLAHTAFQSNFSQWKCDNENGFMGPAHTSAFKKDGNSQDLGSIKESPYFSIVYNNRDGNTLAPVAY